MAARTNAEPTRTTVRLAAWAAALAPLAWLFVRLVLGMEWLRASWDKIGDAGWTAAPRGSAVTGYLNGAVANATGAHPDVSHWFAAATNRFFLPHAEPIAFLVAFGELAIGLALIVGLFTRLSALFGVMMNVLFMFAGTSSTNPQMLLLGIAIVLVGAGAGAYGVDRWVLPWLRGLVGEETTTFARDVAVGAGVVVGAWLAMVATDAQTWLIMIAIAVLVAAAFEYIDRAVFHHPRPAPTAHMGAHG